MVYICEIFGAPRFSSFSTQSAQSGHAIDDRQWVRAMLNPVDKPQAIKSVLSIVRDQA
jgi:hypothetical protein